MENDEVKASFCRGNWDGKGTSARVCKGVVTTGGRDCQSLEDYEGRHGRENPTVFF